MHTCLKPLNGGPGTPGRRQDGPRGATVRQGFTLIEIMIALVIFTMVIGVIYSTWLLIMRAARVGQEVAAQAQSQRMAIRSIEDGLTCVQSFQADMKYYWFAVENGSAPLLSFAARVPANFPRNGKFGGFNVRRLTFSLQTDDNGDKELVLRQNPILMDPGQDQDEFHEQASPLVLARNVQKFTIDCWGTNQQDNAAEWLDEWDNTNAIPQLIRITLVWGGNSRSGNWAGAAPTHTVTRVIAVPSLTLPAIAQGAGPAPVPVGGVQLAPPPLAPPGGNPGAVPPPNSVPPPNNFFRRP